MGFKKSKMRRVVLSIFVLLGSGLLMGQEVSFEAYCDAKEVFTDSYFDITFTLSNADASRINPPSFNDFEIVSGPSIGQSTTIVNGAMTQERSWSYSLKPKRIGTFTIGSATVSTSSGTLKSKPITIKVRKAAPNAIGANENPFVIIEVSDTTVYIGQQLSVVYKLFTQKQVEELSFIEEPDFTGFYSEDVRNTNYRTTREIYNGKQYYTKIIKRISLFPQQPGTMEIGQAVIRIGVTDDNVNKRSFFSLGRIRRINSTILPTTIHVLTLPTPEPQGFSGAVGHFKSIYSITNTNLQSLTTDDAITLTLTIQGDGDIKRVQAPELSFLNNNFEIFDPKLLNEKSYADGKSQLRMQKQYEYKVVPTKAGSYVIEPEFIYFNTDSTSYVADIGQKYPIKVAQGNSSPTIQVDEDIATQNNEIRPLLALSNKGSKRKLWGTPIFFILLMIPLLALGVSYWMKKKAEALSHIHPEELKRQRAAKEAQKRLKIAANFLQKKDSKAFYQEISRALLGYVSDKLQIPTSELSKSNVKERLQSLKVSEDLIQIFLDTLNNCEIALYAGQTNESAMQSSYDNTLTLLTNIEKSV